jgi:dTDP-4-dehydrorhamnose 3,5-epimerase-like enzyme
MKKSLFKNSKAFTSNLPLFNDSRGSLTFTELNKDLPFNVKRCFWIYNVPGNIGRGAHAHKNDHQYLICVKGSVSIEVAYFKEKITINFDKPNMCLYAPPLTWLNLSTFSHDAVLIVLSSNLFNADDYIENFDDYLMYEKS